MIKYFSTTHNHCSEKNGSKCDSKGNKAHVLIWDPFANCWRNCIWKWHWLSSKESSRWHDIWKKNVLSPQQQYVGRYIGHPCCKTKLLVKLFEKILKSTLSQSHNLTIGAKRYRHTHSQKVKFIKGAPCFCSCSDMGKTSPCFLII